MRRLRHRNAVRLNEVVTDEKNDCLCIVTEYLPNGPIMSSVKLIGATPMKESRAKEVSLDLLTWLHYLQIQGVVHRDTKPDNLLTAGDGTVNISDFVSAKAYKGHGDDSNESDFTTVGKPAFAVPEMCASENAPPKPNRGYVAATAVRFV